MSAPQIDILLATYNNAKHLPMLLESLRNQTFKDFRILAHDDGSEDNSPELVKKLAKEDKRIEILEDGKRFHTARGNFMHLLAYSTAPYAICCDADDIWLENKLEILHKTIKQKEENGKPCAVWCNSYVYFPSSGIIKGKATLLCPRHLRDILFCNSGIQGCAILLNEALRKKICHYKGLVAMHDHLITLAALSLGELHYVPMSLMLYRRHKTSVTGYETASIKDKVRDFFKQSKPVLDYMHFEATQEFYEFFKNDLSIKNKRIFEQYLAYPTRSKISNIYHVVREGFKLFHWYVLPLKILMRPIINTPKKK